MLLEKIKSHAILFVLIGLIIILLIFNRPFPSANEQLTILEDESSKESKELIDDEEIQDETSMIVVDVKGAVKFPGVYEMDSQSRVNDVIAKAGGLTEDANERLINLAELVYDEMLIYVPSIDEADDFEMPSFGSEKIRINQATTEQLETLSGIGPAKAAAIINYRDEHGPFRTAEDLLQVPGIGEKTLENIVDQLQIP